MEDSIFKSKIYGESVKLIIDKFNNYHDQKKAIAIDDFPDLLRNEFTEFLIGKTLLKSGDKIYASYTDFNNWLKSKAE